MRRGNSLQQVAQRLLDLFRRYPWLVAGLDKDGLLVKPKVYRGRADVLCPFHRVTRAPQPLIGEPVSIADPHRAGLGNFDQVITLRLGEHVVNDLRIDVTSQSAQR
jgi:hypothetical protein